VTSERVQSWGGSGFVRRVGAGIVTSKPKTLLSLDRGLGSHTQGGSQSNFGAGGCSGRAVSQVPNSGMRRSGCQLMTL
jgi:hypothetical protein